MSDDAIRGGSDSDIADLGKLDEAARERQRDSARCPYELRVLILDPNTERSQALLNAFEALGCPGKIVTCRTADECLAQLAFGGFNAAILSPGDIALTVLTRCRELGTVPDAAVVVVDDDLGPNLAYDCMRAGAAGVFLRPDDLPSACEHFIARLSRQYREWRRRQGADDTLRPEAP